MTLLRPFAAALFYSALAACDLGPPPDRGTFNLKNDTETNLTLLVSDNEQCIIGTHSEVATNTWRNYDIESKAKGAYLCVDGKGHPVQDGKSYRYSASGLNESEAP